MFKKWVQPSSRGTYFFQCKVCNRDYLGGIAALKKHGYSKKHVQNMNTMVKQPTLQKKNV